MAVSICSENACILLKDLPKLKSLLWGNDIKHDVFNRWTQGFCFSDDENTALIQHEGGPCAVIVPVQAFILKHLLFGKAQPSATWRQTSGEARDALLLEAFLELFLQFNGTDTKYYIVTSQVIGVNGTENGDKTVNGDPNTSQDENNERAESSPKKVCYSHEEFHKNLICKECNSQQDLKDTLAANVSVFRQKRGVLLFLYSIILSKGIDQIKNEMEDPSEALIDPIHGHGSQSLINLLLTGRAVSHVFDNEKDISGLKLQGINKRSSIGFLTFLEHLRYLEVGWYLKNPENPIWLLGSETHLSILFSEDGNLVCAETPEAQARRVFTDFDKDGCGFVSGENLGELMAALNLFNDEEYVKIVREKLDPEQLGIVTLNSFMEEFFPQGAQSDTVTSFQLFHYNGLPRSCSGNKVKYQEGTGVLKDNVEVQFVTDTSAIKHCLMTKWPTIELSWQNQNIPSLN